MKIPVILHLTDIHFSELPFYFAYWRDHNSDVHTDLLHDIKALDPKPNFIVVSGDLSRFGEKASFKAADDFLKNLQEICGIDDKRRVVVVPGNHDVRLHWRLFSITRGLRNYRQFFRDNTVDYYSDYGVSIFGFNSNVLGLYSLFIGGHIGDDQLSEIREHFDTRRSDRGFVESVKIAVLHHHPYPIPKPKGNNFNVLRDAGKFLQQLTDWRFDIILHGHMHFPYVSTVKYLWRNEIQQEILIVSGGTAMSRRIKPCGFNQYGVLTIDTP
ncbi:MAG: metallophosphoesterase [Deltaproteobacteria bacterium]|nr:metallophosphoesterase [Deltaproteobacteria bacterium]